MPRAKRKFDDPFFTAKGEDRAFVDFTEMECLWFNTGTLCNLTCENCYIESSPKNDRLQYLTLEDVRDMLDQAEATGQRPSELGFTGGEPFMNPYFSDILEHVLGRGYQVLILTNAMKPMMKQQSLLLKLHQSYGDKLAIRVSLDHYTQEGHEAERGKRTWQATLDGIAFLLTHGIRTSIASRLLQDETQEQVLDGFKTLFLEQNWSLDPYNTQDLVLFAEMDTRHDVAEITTACWDILGKDPNRVMCANSRMVVRHKGAPAATIAACTLLPYEDAFNYGPLMEKALGKTYLNHPYCAQFCVLGGSSCS